MAQEDAQRLSFLSGEMSKGATKLRLIQLAILLELKKSNKIVNFSIRLRTQFQWIDESIKSQTTSIWYISGHGRYVQS
jgi:hypothetical protein